MEELHTVTWLLMVLATYAQLQSSVERPCPGERVTFTCTIESAAHRWEVSSLGFSRSLVAGDLGRVFSDPPFEFNVTGDMAGSITSTATVNATTNYNDTIVVCQDGIGSLTDQSTTINIIGPPSVPTLSCVDLSGDVNGTMNVTVSWTLSGGDSADFYLISITTNGPQTPYGGLLNITNASVTQHELTGFMAGYEYNITVRGTNCGSLVGGESKTLTIRPQAPATPDMFEVCSVYDKVNRTLQIIETIWNEQVPVNVSEDCTNGRNIRASYELSYTNVNGTSCVVDTTNCSNGVCRYELQNTTADSSCQPLFSGEDVTVSITATNIVGSSNPAMPRSINGTNDNILGIRVDTTNPTKAFVECTFQAGYNCTIDYGRDPSFSNLTMRGISSTASQDATIPLTPQLKRNTDYYYIVSAESSSQCVRVRGRFRTECTVEDLTRIKITTQDMTVDQRCIGRGFLSNVSILHGVVCYNGTTEGSTAVYICNNITHPNEVIRVCQSDGTWNGSISSCPVSRRLERWQIALIVIGAITLELAILHANVHEASQMDGLQILVIVVATIFWVIGVILWIAVGAVVNNPPNGNVLDPDWQHRRDTLSYIGLATSIIAIILIAAAACYLVWRKRDKMKNWQFPLIIIATICCVTGVAMWCAVGVVVSNSPDGNVLDLDWQHLRDTLSYLGLAFSIVASIFVAVVIWVLVCCNSELQQKVRFNLSTAFTNSFNHSIPGIGHGDHPDFALVDCPTEFLCTEDEVYELLSNLDITKANRPDLRCIKARVENKKTITQKQILLIVIATIFWVTVVALWCAVGVVVSNPPNGNVLDPHWQLSRNALIGSAFGVSTVVIILTAAAVSVRIYRNENNIKKFFLFVLLVIATALSVIGVGLLITVTVVVYIHCRNRDETNESDVKLKRVVKRKKEDEDKAGSALEEASQQSEQEKVSSGLVYAEVGPHVPLAAVTPPASDSHVQYTAVVHDQNIAKGSEGTLPTNVDSTSLPHTPLDSEGSPPPPIPPQQFSDDDSLHSPKLPESSEPQQSAMDAPPPRLQMTNQEDAVPPCSPKTHQQTAVSVFALLGVLVCVCHE